MVAVSGRPALCGPASNKIEEAKTIEERSDDGIFDSLFAKLATAAANQIFGEAKRRFDKAELAQYKKSNKFLTGPQVVWWIINDPRNDDKADRTVRDTKDRIKFKIENVHTGLEAYQTSCDRLLLKSKTDHLISCYTFFIKSNRAQ